jgi:hypothetical protein
MRSSPLTLGLLGCLALAGCLGPNWSAGPAMLAPDQDVAAALGESAVAAEKFDPASLPDIGQPTATRPCCGFGMDLQIAIAGARVLGYSIPNVQSVEDLGRHEYDCGVLTFDTDLTRLATVENDGLVYTCRGGFIDTGHVRDYADLTLFLTLRFVAALPGPAVFTLPGDGAVRRVRLEATPPEALSGADRWEWAVRLAQYTAFHLSVFHELVTWYGHQTNPAWSERASAFSPEDLYSNLLGIRIAGGIIGRQGMRTRRDWNASMDAWLPRALRRMQPLPRDLGRRAMKDVDGLWWDSSKVLPDVWAVPRRNYSVDSPLLPWRVEDAQVGLGHRGRLRRDASPAAGGPRQPRRRLPHRVAGHGRVRARRLGARGTSPSPIPAPAGRSWPSSRPGAGGARLGGARLRRGLRPAGGKTARPAPLAEKR